ncbi:fungal-specific transcription factor domain-containing protein [Mycena crocata]|nr:fungal-specific transcription factor domain-containing protein [Mycena crocata]
MPAVPKGTQGACDICRRQKVRCDSATMPGNRCSKCIAFDSECTHNFSKVKPAKGTRTRRKRIIQTPKDQDQDAVKKLVIGLLVGSYDAPQDRDALVELLLQVSRYARSLEQELLTRQSRTLSTQTQSSPSSHSQAGDCDATVTEIPTNPDHPKQLLTNTASELFVPGGPDQCGSLELVEAAIETVKPNAVVPFGSRSKREEFWRPSPWEASPHPEPCAIQIFPEPDLLNDLIEIYFTQFNIYLLILHRPTFERELRDGVHLRDPRFGAVVLAVCAFASKNSADPRVLLPGQGELSAGWKWYAQIRRPFSGTAESASLYDLQLCSLVICLRKAGTHWETVWSLCGIALVHAQDIGAHKHTRHIDGQVARWTVEAELSTRLCYHLCMFDAFLSSYIGRERAGNGFERDLPLPLPCDDQYWEHEDPAQAFKQPLGRPAQAEYIIAHIRLMDIYSAAIRKQDTLTMVQIDTRLDAWAAAEIPEHLLWNPYMEDNIFFAQSSALYVMYYHAQILLHRPLLHAAIQVPSSSAFKSLAICANAARSIAHVVDVGSRRGLLPHMPPMKAACDAGVVLVLNISGGARSGLSIDTNRELVAVYKCLALLRAGERRWQNAGRMTDILSELLLASDLPLPESVAPEAASGDSSSGEADDIFTLPMAIDDLSRLPIYDSLGQMDPLASLPLPDVENNILAEHGLFVANINTATAAVDVDAPSSQFGFGGMGSVNAGSFFRNMPLADTSFISNDVDMNGYMAEWIPYWSGASTLVQAMQNTHAQ